VPRRRQRLRLIGQPTHSVDFILHRRVFYHARARRLQPAATQRRRLLGKYYVEVRRCSVCHQVRAPTEITHRRRALHAWIFTADELPLCTQPQTERNFWCFVALAAGRRSGLLFGPKNLSCSRRILFLVMHDF